MIRTIRFVSLTKKSTSSDGSASRARERSKNTEIDVGGVIQLKCAALAHAEKNPSRSAFRVALIGEFDLAGERSGAQREANGGGKRGVGDPRERPRRLRHVPDFGKIGEGDDERGVLFREPQQAHQLGFVLGFDVSRFFDQRLDALRGIAREDAREPCRIARGRSVR
jgi:hypothetical protein